MFTEIVETTTSDGIPLAGAYFESKGETNLAIDTLIYFHGDGGHFYSKLLLQLGDLFSTRGITFLAANRRGHDIVSNGARGKSLQGYAFESVADCILDYAAWLDFLASRGKTQIAIGGHSGGAVRATYAQANQHFKQVKAVISVSPGEYEHRKVAAIHGDKFTSPYIQAQQHIADSQPDLLLRPGVPWGSTWTAKAFVDCFNEDNRYSVSAHAASTGVPTLYVFGGKESEIGGDEELPVCGLAMRTLKQLQYPHTTVEVVEGANHGYANREIHLSNVIYNFLQKL